MPSVASRSRSSPARRSGLVGESGSGKSLTALAVIGLLPTPPASLSGGRIRLGGTDILDGTSDRLRALRGTEIGMVFQEPLTSLNPVCSIGAHFRAAIGAHRDVSRREAHAIATAMLDRVRIARPSERLRQYPHELSGGMRQRVMLALALCLRPRLLLADEPTTALDVSVQADILTLIRELQRDLGMAVLFISHNLAVVAEVADRVAVMYAGEIVEEAAVADLFRRPLHPYTAALLRSLPGRRPPGEDLDVIPGQVPGRGELEHSCRFVTRCEFATPACSAGEIEAERLEACGERSVRCLRWRELVEAVDPE